MSNKIYFVSFYDRNGDIWGQQVAATDHEDAFMQAYDALLGEEEILALLDLPAKFYVDEIEALN